MSDSIELYEAGPGAILIELGDRPPEIRRARDSLARLGGIDRAVPGFDSIFVTFDPDAISPREIREYAVAAVASVPDDRADGELLTIPVSMAAQDAPDLGLVCERTGLSPSDLRALLESLELRGRFEGFLPGFVYLDGLPPELDLPRRPASRPRVPAGSFGIAAGMAGFYPADSPGGWNLIGRTPAGIREPARNPPNLIRPVHRVRLAVFDSMEAAAGAWDDPRRARELEQRPKGAAIAEVVDAGQHSLLVGGEEGPHAFDPEAARAANLAVGNREHSVVIEVAAVGPTLRLAGSAVCSWYGGGAMITLDGVPVPATSQFSAGAGSELRIGALREGWRGWLAFRGGLASDPPRRLQPGDHLSLEKGSASDAPRLMRLARKDRTTIDVWAGPHPADSGRLHELVSIVWRVSGDLDRTGIGLRSPAAGAGPPGVPSCGMRVGSVQWQPDGRLVVMGPDHPVTGGYRQPFSVDPGQIWKLAALRPGDEIRWRLLRHAGASRTSFAR